MFSIFLGKPIHLTRLFLVPPYSYKRGYCSILKGYTPARISIVFLPAMPTLFVPVFIIVILNVNLSLLDETIPYADRCPHSINVG